MELDATGIEGQNQKLLQLQTKFEALMKSAKDGLEVDASAIAATASTDITSAISELRTLTPKLPELPSVNLQAQLSGLSGLVAGLPQHTQALAGIATKFGSALTASGFSLDTLVSDAASAIGAGTSLSAKIPNFELPSVGDPFQKAIEVLQANPIKPEDLADLAEKTSELVESPNFIALKAELETTAETIAEQMKTIDISGLQLPEDTDITVEKLISDTENPIRKLPTNDDEYFSPTEESTKIAFQYTIDPGPSGISEERRTSGALGGKISESSAPTKTVVFQKKVTTNENATTSQSSSSFSKKEITDSGGKETIRRVSKKANVSPHGFSYRPVEVTEHFYEEDVQEAVHADFKFAVELEHDPVKILSVYGYVPTAKRMPHFAREIHPNTDYITNTTQSAKSKDGKNRDFDVYRRGTYGRESISHEVVYTKEVEITQDAYKYGPAAARFDTVDVDGNTITKPHRHRGVVFRVTYQYADFYDPRYSPSSTGY